MNPTEQYKERKAKFTESQNALFEKTGFPASYTPEDDGRSVPEGEEVPRQSQEEQLQANAVVAAQVADANELLATKAQEAQERKLAQDAANEVVRTSPEEQADLNKHAQESIEAIEQAMAERAAKLNPPSPSLIQTERRVIPEAPPPPVVSSLNPKVAPAVDVPRVSPTEQAEINFINHLFQDDAQQAVVARAQRFDDARKAESDASPIQTPPAQQLLVNQKYKQQQESAEAKMKARALAHAAKMRQQAIDADKG